MDLDLIVQVYLVEDAQDADVRGDDDTQRHHQTHEEHVDDVTATVETGNDDISAAALENRLRQLLLLVPIHRTTNK